MTTQYNVNTVVQGVNGYGLPFCDTIYASTLASGSEQTLTIPGKSSTSTGSVNKYIAVFSYAPASKVFVSVNNTAAVPLSSNFTASTSELNPPAKYVKAGDVLHFITAGTNIDVTVAIYQLMGF